MKDTIYREDAIEAVWKPQVKPNELIFDALKRAIESTINNLPSADRPQGKWINGHFINGVNYKRCDQCFAEIEDSFFGESSFDVNFCPNCGARMKQA